jgi:hypothetical protein
MQTKIFFFKFSQSNLKTPEVISLIIESDEWKKMPIVNEIITPLGGEKYLFFKEGPLAVNYMKDYKRDGYGWINCSHELYPYGVETKVLKCEYYKGKNSENTGSYLKSIFY